MASKAKTPAKAPNVDDIEELSAYQSDDDEPDTVTGVDKPGAEKPKDQVQYITIHASSFKEFLLKPELLRAIVDCGFEHPSEVQHECVPQAVLGTDVLCQAKSGMGKTAVFVLAVLQQLDETPAPGSAIILCHTRELAYQICSEFDRLKKYLTNLKTCVVYGGVPIQTNKDLLKTNPHIIIGTPGRVLQLIKEKDLNTTNVKHFVLDECDKMLEGLEMRRDVQNIFKATPRDKQVMMFSATLPEEMRVVAKKFMHNPLEIYINDGAKLTLHGLQQYFVPLKENEKNRKLVDLLDALEFNQLIIFVKSVQRAKSLNDLLVECNFPSTALHANLKQPERLEIYRKFKEFKTRILVATNIVGRGVDVERVNVVINYDMPADADTYLHRVGRAGRFGTKGLAISFVSSDEDKEVLKQVQAKFVVQVPELPDELDATTYMGA